MRLALCVKEHPGITLAGIRAALPGAYGDAFSDDPTDEQAARRRFERDKDTLRGCGVFLVADSEGRYSIDALASYAAPVDLTDAQASLLRLLCSALLDDPSYPLKNELRMILAKIGDDLGVPDLLPGSDARARGRAGGRGRAREQAVTGLAKVRKAITARKRLHFDYEDAGGRASTREVEPFGCFFLRKNCYVVAFDPQAAGERVFRLDRMSHMRVNGTHPSAPDFAARPFDAAEWYGLPFQFGEEDYEAQVRFDAENAWRAERLRMGQGTLATCDDAAAGAGGAAAGAEAGGGAVVWTVRVRDTRALARWCIENGPGIVPAAPPRAAAAWREGVAAALRALDAASGQDAAEAEARA